MKNLWHSVGREKVDKFQKIFGTELKTYFDPVFFGFDVMTFSEDYLNVPEDESAEDFIQEKYGTEAVELIKFLMDVI